MLYIAGFIIGAAIIFFAGKNLSVYGDLLAEKTGLSKGWIGIILMASVTSLPELMVGISSSAIVKSADLATGDILGSCAFNLGLLAMLDAFVPQKKTLTGLASSTHTLNAGLGIILLSLVGFSLLLKQDVAILTWFGLSSILLIAGYLISVRIIYFNEMKNISIIPAVQRKQGEPEMKKIVLNYILYALILIAAALALPYFADKIAKMSGLGESFTGTFFLAVSTSLPEIAVSLVAIRRGSIDLAVGNLLGSNIFNILILAIDDLFYTRGILLQDADSVNIFSVMSTIIMSAVVIIGLSYRAAGKRFWLAWDAALIFIVYIINLVILYRHTH